MQVSRVLYRSLGCCATLRREAARTEAPGAPCARRPRAAAGTSGGCLRLRRDRGRWRRGGLDLGDDAAGRRELPREHALGCGGERVAGGQVVERGRRPRPGRRVVPQARGGVEAVQRQQLPALTRDQVDRLDDVVEHRLADEVVEADAGEPEHRSRPPAHHLRVHRRRPGGVDRIDAMDVRAGAEAPAARLDPEQVAQQGDHKVRVQHPARVADAERDDRQPLQRRVAENPQVRVLAPRRGARAGRKRPRAGGSPRRRPRP